MTQNDGACGRFNSLPDALVTVSNRINWFLQSRTTMPRIANPVLPQEDFTRHWDQNKYEHFRQLFNVYNQRINSAIDAVEHDDSIDRWRQVFGERFGSKRGVGSGGTRKVAGSAPFVSVTPGRPHAR